MFRGGRKKRRKLRHVSVPVSVRKSSLPLPTPEQEEKIFQLLAGRKFWVMTQQRRTWVDFPSRETARLLCLRLHRPETGAEALLAGRIFRATPTVSIRLAVQLSRIDRRRDDETRVG
jgi:hypothetical protein